MRSAMWPTAWRRWRNWRMSTFDAVLLDLDLPGVDGFQIARLIRQREHAGDASADRGGHRPFRRRRRGARAGGGHGRFPAQAAQRRAAGPGAGEDSPGTAHPARGGRAGLSRLSGAMPCHGGNCRGEAASHVVLVQLEAALLVLAPALARSLALGRVGRHHFQHALETPLRAALAQIDQQRPVGACRYPAARSARRCRHRHRRRRAGAGSWRLRRTPTAGRPAPRPGRNRAPGSASAAARRTLCGPARTPAAAAARGSAACRSGRSRRGAWASESGERGNGERGTPRLRRAGRFGQRNAPPVAHGNTGSPLIVRLPFPVPRSPLFILPGPAATAPAG